MTLLDLTDLWCESALLSHALDGLPTHVRIHWAAPPDPLANAGAAQAILAGSGIRYDTAIFDRLPQLRLLVRTGIGIDNVDVAAATAHGVLFCNTPDGPTESTAEHTVALMLAALKRLKQGNDHLVAGRFSPREVAMGNEAMGKTLGLVGLGRIGRRVAQICRLGLNMEVLAYDPFVSSAEAAQLGVVLTDLDGVIAGADVLSLHAPSTPETYHLINAQRIAQMKDGAYLLNLARGPLVDAEALLAALDSGKLAGAGLDVFDPEPLPVDSPLRCHPKLVVTPHSATTTVEGRSRIEQMAVEEVLRFFRGEKPNNPLNPTVYGR